MLFRSFSALLLPLIAVVYAGYSGQATYFEVGLYVIVTWSKNLSKSESRGACGWVNVPTDFVSSDRHSKNYQRLNIALIIDRGP